MKKAFLILSVVLLYALPSSCAKIDGRFWDWIPFDSSYGMEYECKPHILLKDRSGLELKIVRLALGKKYIYVMLEGRSVTGQERDKGQGFRRTSVRISFSSAQSPLNRVRVLADPQYPGEIKISMPNTDTVTLGSVNDRYWASGKYSGRYAIELKIPIYVSSKGVHVGSKQGPLIEIAEGGSGRKRLSDILVNTVDTTTHRLVSTSIVSIKPGEL